MMRCHGDFINSDGGGDNTKISEIYCCSLFIQFIHMQFFFLTLVGTMMGILEFCCVIFGGHSAAKASAAGRIDLLCVKKKMRCEDSRPRLKKW